MLRAEVLSPGFVCVCLCLCPYFCPYFCSSFCLCLSVCVCVCVFVLSSYTDSNNAFCKGASAQYCVSVAMVGSMSVRVLVSLPVPVSVLFLLLCLCLSLCRVLPRRLRCFLRRCSRPVLCVCLCLCLATSVPVDMAAHVSMSASMFVSMSCRSALTSMMLLAEVLSPGLVCLSGSGSESIGMCV